jgi:hypothetical protein
MTHKIRRRSDGIHLSEVAALNITNQLAYNMENELDEESSVTETDKPTAKKNKTNQIRSYFGCLYRI